MAESKGFDGLCPSSATRTPDYVRLRRGGLNPLLPFPNKKRTTHPKVYHSFWRRARDSMGSAHRSLREHPIMFGFAEGVRIPFYIFKQKKNDIPFSISFFLAESKGFEPSKRFWPFTRFPIVLLRPARTTLHLLNVQRIYILNSAPLLKCLAIITN